jgi:hypothetical protein
MKHLFIIVFISITTLFTGCIHSVSQQGLTIKVPAYQITQSLEKQFPITENLQYGKVTLQNPKALLRAGSDRVQAGAMVGITSPFIHNQKGSILLSGIPVFDAKSGAIYLTKPNIDKLELNGYKLTSMIKGPIKDAIMPIIHQIFRTRPIYRLNKNSIQSMFVNNIQVSNGELLVTFGI